MCYDIKTSLESQLRRAEFNSDEQAIRELKEKLKPFVESNLYHASGYAHPRTLIYPDNNPYLPEVSVWGLIPFWVKGNDKKNQLWNSTLNARGETIFDKPSFRDSAKKRRCIIVLDGFYEHHHKGGKTFPYFIQKKSGEPLTVAGLWSEWLEKETGELVNSFTIVTTKANALLQRIHNNPKLKEARMPVLLADDDIDTWLKPLTNDLDKTAITALIKPWEGEELTAHTVRRLRGKEAQGNVPEATREHHYPELAQELF